MYAGVQVVEVRTRATADARLLLALALGLHQRGERERPPTVRTISSQANSKNTEPVAVKAASDDVSGYGACGPSSCPSLIRHSHPRRPSRYFHVLRVRLTGCVLDLLASSAVLPASPRVPVSMQCSVSNDDAAREYWDAVAGPSLDLMMASRLARSSERATADATTAIEALAHDHQ